MSSADNNHTEEYTIKGYVIGFILAVLLTFLSFIPVMKDLLHNWTVGGKILYLLGMGFLQIIVQSFYFLHLQHGIDAKWKIWTYIFGLTAASIVVTGSWWAIQHLNYNMMGGSGRIVTPPTIETEIPPATIDTPPTTTNYAPASTNETPVSNEVPKIDAGNVITISPTTSSDSSANSTTNIDNASSSAPVSNEVPKIDAGNVITISPATSSDSSANSTINSENASSNAPVSNDENKTDASSTKAAIIN